MFGRKGKSVSPWSQRRNYKGGHRVGVPKKGSQFRKHTLRGLLFGRSGGNLNHWL